MKKVFLQLYNHPLFGLLLRYGVVGTAASIIHFSISYVVFNYLDVNSFIAHFCGFIFGLFTAYFGHYFYSFNDNEQHGRRFPKFLVTALVALVLHQGGVYILVNYYNLDYLIRVLPLLVITVPVFTFLLNKFWVFSDSDESK